MTLRDFTPGYGPSSWGKQVAVRFKADELEQLDRVVAQLRKEKAHWFGRGIDRSYAIRELVKRAAAELKPEPKPVKP